MPAALLLVVSPILHPIAAAAGQFILWEAGVDLLVLEKTRLGWRIVRRLGYDNGGAMGVHLVDGALSVAYRYDGVSAPPEHLPILPNPTQQARPPLTLLR